MLLDGLKTAQTSNYAVCEGNSAEGAGHPGLTGSVLSVPPPQAWRWLLLWARGLQSGNILSSGCVSG